MITIKNYKNRKEQKKKNTKRKIVIINPPKYGSKWNLRLSKYNGFQRIPIPNITVAQIIGIINENIKDSEVHYIDCEIEQINDKKELKKIIDNINPSAIINLIGTYSIDLDLRFTSFDYPLINLITPFTTDARDAIKILKYYHNNSFFIKQDKISKFDLALIEGLKEIFKKGKIEKTKGYIITKENKIIDTGNFISTKKLKYNSDFIKAKFPEYLNKQKEFNVRDPIVYYLTKEGCPFNCSYCSQAQTTLYFKDIDKIIKELNTLKKIGYKEIFFIDNEFGINKEHAKEVCKAMIKNKINLKWRCMNRVELADEELYKLMSLSGCYAIFYGIESFDEKVKNKIPKFHDDKIIEKAIRLTRKYNMKVGIFIMFGLINEDKETYKINRKNIKKYNPDFIEFSVMYPAPSSPLYLLLKEKDKIINYDWKTYKDPTVDIFKIRYYKNRKYYYKIQLIFENYALILKNLNLYKKEKKIKYIMRLIIIFLFMESIKILFPLYIFIRDNKDIKIIKNLINLYTKITK